MAFTQFQLGTRTYKTVPSSFNTRSLSSVVGPCTIFGSLLAISTSHKLESLISISNNANSATYNHGTFSAYYYYLRLISPPRHLQLCDACHIYIYPSPPRHHNPANTRARARARVISSSSSTHDYNGQFQFPPELTIKRV